MFLAALAALYLTLVNQWVDHCQFWVLTRRVTFETWDPSEIWWEWCLTKRWKVKKDKKTKRQNIKNTKWQRDKEIKRKKDTKKKWQKDERQRTKRDFFYCDFRVVSQSCNFLLCSNILPLCFGDPGLKFYQPAKSDCQQLISLSYIFSSKLDAFFTASYNII